MEDGRQGTEGGDPLSLCAPGVLARDVVLCLAMTYMPRPPESAEGDEIQTSANATRGRASRLIFLALLASWREVILVSAAGRAGQIRGICAESIRITTYFWAGVIIFFFFPLTPRRQPGNYRVVVRGWDCHAVGVTACATMESAPYRSADGAVGDEGVGELVESGGGKEAA